MSPEALLPWHGLLLRMEGRWDPTLLKLNTFFVTIQLDP